MPFHRKISVLVLLLLGSIMPVTSYALDLYGFGSYWEIEDTEGTWGGGVGLSIPLFSRFLQLDGRAYVFENSDLDDDDELELLPLDIGLQIHLLAQERYNFYILGGASYVYADADRAEVDAEFGAYVGGGIQFNLMEHMALFGEGIYRKIELGSDVGRLDEEIDVSGLTANVGLKIIL